MKVPSQYFTSTVFLCFFLLVNLLQETMPEPLHSSNNWSCRHGPPLCWANFEMIMSALWREHSSQTKVRFPMIMQFLVLMYVLSTLFAWTTPNTSQLRCLMKRVFCQAEQHGQLFILHCSSNYHSDKDSPLLRISSRRWCSSLRQRHFQLDNFVYSVGVKTTEML